jgi:twitching motility protein PilT
LPTGKSDATARASPKRCGEPCGELRDLDTMRTAMQAADTGHLVFSTVHTTNAALTVQRLVAMFPAGERELLQLQLATNLAAVISQRLAKRKAGGRIPVVEIMRDTPVIRKAILDGRVSSLPQAIANRDSGMQLFDQYLAELYNRGEISGTEALRLASNPEAVALAMKGITIGDTSGGLVR